MWATCSVWVVGAVVWALADLPNAWGPDPDAGLVIYSVLGAGADPRQVPGRRPAGVPAQ